MLKSHLEFNIIGYHFMRVFLSLLYISNVCSSAGPVSSYEILSHYKILYSKIELDTKVKLIQVETTYPHRSA